MFAGATTVATRFSMRYDVVDCVNNLFLLVSAQVIEVDLCIDGHRAFFIARIHNQTTRERNEKQKNEENDWKKCE